MDLPIKLEDKDKGLQVLSHFDSTLPPGASAVRQTVNKGTGWYCTACASFIVPVWVRRAKTVFPCCMECFGDELAVYGGDEGVAILAEAASTGPELSSN